MNKKDQDENKTLVSMQPHPDFKFDRQNTQYGMETGEEGLTSRDYGNIKIRNTIKAAEEKLAEQNPGMK